jgi:hypothetical protein
MSKSAREQMKRKYDRALNGVEKAIEHLQGMKLIYDGYGENYKKYSDYLEVLIVQQLVVQENLLIFRQNFL